MLTLPLFLSALTRMFGGLERDLSTVLRLMSGR